MTPPESSLPGPPVVVAPGLPHPTQMVDNVGVWILHRPGPLPRSTPVSETATRALSGVYLAIALAQFRHPGVRKGVAGTMGWCLHRRVRPG